MFVGFAPHHGWVLRWAEAGAEVETEAVVKAEAGVEAGFQMV